MRTSFSRREHETQSARTKGSFVEDWCSIHGQDYCANDESSACGNAHAQWPSRTRPKTRPEMQVEHEQGKQLKYCFSKNEICDRICSQGVSFSPRFSFSQNRLWKIFFGAVIVTSCFSLVTVCGLWMFIWPVSLVQGVSRLQIGRDESAWNERE